MALNYLMQARSSSNGQLYTWTAVTADFAAAGFPGPGSAQEVAVLNKPAEGATGTFLPFDDDADAWDHGGFPSKDPGHQYATDDPEYSAQILPGYKNINVEIPVDEPLTTYLIIPIADNAKTIIRVEIEARRDGGVDQTHQTAYMIHFQRLDGGAPVEISARKEDTDEGPISEITDMLDDYAVVGNNFEVQLQGGDNLAHADLRGWRVVKQLIDRAV